MNVKTALTIAGSFCAFLAVLILCGIGIFFYLDKNDLLRKVSADVPVVPVKIQPSVKIPSLAEHPAKAETAKPLAPQVNREDVEKEIVDRENLFAELEEEYRQKEEASRRKVDKR